MALVSRSLPRASGLNAPARLAAATPARRRAYLTPSPRKTWSSFSGNGISTVCPSPTPYGLGLGPTNPTWMYLPSEPLGIRWGAFSAPSRYSCRHSHSTTLHNRSRGRFTAEIDAPLPIPQKGNDVASAPCLSPVTLSAQDHSTSELLRTLSRVAASKPTSWLSVQSHIVSHLASNLGP